MNSTKCKENETESFDLTIENLNIGPLISIPELEMKEAQIMKEVEVVSAVVNVEEKNNGEVDDGQNSKVLTVVSELPTALEVDTLLSDAPQNASIAFTTVVSEIPVALEIETIQVDAPQNADIEVTTVDSEVPAKSEIDSLEVNAPLNTSIDATTIASVDPAALAVDTIQVDASPNTGIEVATVVSDVTTAREVGTLEVDAPQNTGIDVTTVASDVPAPQKIDALVTNVVSEVLASLKLDMDHRGDSDDSTSSDSSAAGVVADLEDFSDDEDDRRKKPEDKRGPVTPGELLLQELPPIEELLITVDENVKMEKVGTVFSTINVLVMVRSLPNLRPLDEGTILFLDGKKILGQVFETWGAVLSPFYSVRFNSVADILERGIETGADVFYAPEMSEFTHYVFVEKLKQLKGSDASWEGNNEPPEKYVDYSDDEKEQLAKAKHRAKNCADEDEAGDNPEKSGKRAKILTKKGNNNVNSNENNRNFQRRKDDERFRKPCEQQRNGSDARTSGAFNKWTRNPFLKVWPPPADQCAPRDARANGNVPRPRHNQWRPNQQQQHGTHINASSNPTGPRVRAGGASNQSAVSSSSPCPRPDNQSATSTSAPLPRPVSFNPSRHPSFGMRLPPPPLHYVSSPYGMFQPPPSQNPPYGTSQPSAFISTNASQAPVVAASQLRHYFPSQPPPSHPPPSFNLPQHFPSSTSLPPPIFSSQPPPFSSQHPPSQPPPSHPPSFNLTQLPLSSAGPPPSYRLAYQPIPPQPFASFDTFHSFQPSYSGYPPMGMPPPPQVVYGNSTPLTSRPPPPAHQFGNPANFGGGYRF